MFQYRAVLVRLCARAIPTVTLPGRLMGRPKVAALRALTTQQGWLAPDTPLPEDGEIAAVLGQARRARSTISTVEPFRDVVARWAEQGVGYRDPRSRCVASMGTAVRFRNSAKYAICPNGVAASRWFQRTCTGLPSASNPSTVSASPTAAAPRFLASPIWWLPQ